MKRLFLITAATLSLFMASVVVATPTFAANLPDAEKTTFTFNGKRENVTIRDVIIEVFKFLTVLVGVLAAGGYAYAGIIYSSAGGNPGQTQKSMTIMANTTLGLIGFFGMYGIVIFFIPENVLR